MSTARNSSRWGHRDASMILIAYRHGLRAVELCDLQWHQVELAAGRLHVRRNKRGTPSVHPIQGDELRALRRLQREEPPGPYLFMPERGGPIAAKNHKTLWKEAQKLIGTKTVQELHDPLDVIETIMRYFYSLAEALKAG